MGIFIIGIIVAISGIVVLTLKIPYKGVISIVAFVLAILLIGSSFISIVPTGYTGVLTTFGKIEDKTVNAGLNIIAPWQRIVKLDNRTQNVTINTSAFSSDIQQVDIALTVNYRIDEATANRLYRSVGINYYSNVVVPRILENTKSIFSKYTAEKLVEKRNTLSNEIESLVSNDMSSYGIIIDSISVINIDFTDAFTNAVEAKQVAQQNKLTAETEQAQLNMIESAQAERAIIIANTEAEKAIIQANADLEVVKIQAEASLYAGEKEAEMNKRIGESLTNGLINYYYIKQWNGELPTTMLGADTNTSFVMMPNS